MKLYVDDIRRCPEGWHLARTITDAIRVLATAEVDTVSLDHDIMCENGQNQHSSWETFEAVAFYIALMGDRKPKDIQIHTANIGAGQRMADIMGVPYYNQMTEVLDGKIENY